MRSGVRFANVTVEEGFGASMAAAFLFAFILGGAAAEQPGSGGEGASLSMRARKQPFVEPQSPGCGMPSARGCPILLRSQDASERRPSSSRITVLIFLIITSIKDSNTEDTAADEHWLQRPPISRGDIDRFSEPADAFPFTSILGPY